MSALAAAAAMLFALVAPAGEEAPPSGAASPSAGQQRTGKLSDRDEPAGDAPPADPGPAGTGAASETRPVAPPPDDQRTGEVRTDDAPTGRSPPGAPSAGDPRANEAAEPPPVDPGSRQPLAGDMVAVDASPATSDSFPVHRLGYVTSGGLALTGAAFGFIARSEAIRAGTLTSARESSATLVQARDHAATANFCFALAGATALYALVLEFLPRPAADAASLAFRF
jgi:hypothetical protein